MEKIILFLLFSSSIVFGSEVSMNDIKLLQYGDFTQKWKLVTVRFRQDSHEMRFTYANDLAWESMTKGVAVYPDGAVFAKVGFKSGVDPAFNSSIVPSGARRFQFMVKDAKKYAETDGWGYALFQSNGELFEGDQKTATFSCHACHKLVAERNFVFSEPIEVSPVIKKIRTTYNLEKNKSHLFYTSLKAKDYQSNLKKFKNKIGENSLEIIDGDMREYFFGGTLDEVTPLLINHVLLTKKPSGFVSRDQGTFKILKFSKNGKSCSAEEYAFDIYEFRSEWQATREVEAKVICYSKKSL